MSPPLEPDAALAHRAAPQHEVQNLQISAKCKDSELARTLRTLRKLRAELRLSLP